MQTWVRRNKKKALSLLEIKQNFWKRGEKNMDKKIIFPLLSGNCDILLKTNMLQTFGRGNIWPCPTLYIVLER